MAFHMALYAHRCDLIEHGKSKILMWVTATGRGGHNNCMELCCHCVHFQTSRRTCNSCCLHIDTNIVGWKRNLSLLRNHRRENIHDKAQRNQIVGWVHCVTFSCVLLRLDEQWRHKQGIFSRRTQRTMPVNMGCECVCLRILSTYVHIYQYTVLANSNQRSIFLKKFLDSRPNSLT